MKLDLSAEELRPIVEAVVAQVVGHLEADRGKLNGRLAYTEPEGAALLGVAPHVLRDARLRGEITATRIGKRIGYERDELAAYLRRGRDR